MKKKNNYVRRGGIILQAFADDYLQRTGNMITRLLHAGKHYLNKGRACLSEGNIFGENEEDFFSHPLSA